MCVPWDGELLLPGGRPTAGALRGLVRSSTGKAGMLAGAAAIEVAADLAGNVGLTAVSCPCLPSWPSGIKKRAVRGGVLPCEATLAPSPGFSLACASEGFSLKLRVNVAPGSKLEPACFPPKGNIICQTCR